MTPNNPAGSPTGPNKLQPYPVITGTFGQQVDGTLTAAPSTKYTLSFYSNTDPDPSGYGQGQTSAGSLVVTTDATGLATFSYYAPYSVPALTVDQYISATATDPSGNTSEFSNNAVVLPPSLQLPVASVDSTVPVAAQGQSVTFLGTVAASEAAGPATGLVGFVVDGTVIGFAPLNSLGIATFTTDQLPVGTDSVTLAYLGDATHPSAFSAPFSQKVTPARNPSPLTVVYSTDQAAAVTSPVTFVGVVAPTTAGTPTGLVGFVVDGSVVGFARLNSLGIATFTTNTLAAGTHSVTLAYLGDSTFSPTFSPAYSQQILSADELPRPTTVVYSTTPSAPVGAPVTFVGVVSPTTVGTPTGLVVFLVDGLEAGTAELNSLGIATFTTNTLSVGTHQIILGYVGDLTHYETDSETYTQQIVPA